MNMMQERKGPVHHRPYYPESRKKLLEFLDALERAMKALDHICGDGENRVSEVIGVAEPGESEEHAALSDFAARMKETILHKNSSALTVLDMIDDRAMPSDLNAFDSEWRRRQNRERAALGEAIDHVSRPFLHREAT